MKNIITISLLMLCIKANTQNNQFKSSSSSQRTRTGIFQSEKVININNNPNKGSYTLNITPNTSDEELKKHIHEAEKVGVDLKFSNVKRNATNQIIALNTDIVVSKTRSMIHHSSGNEPIQDFTYYVTKLNNGEVEIQKKEGDGSFTSVYDKVSYNKNIEKQEANAKLAEQNAKIAEKNAIIAEQNALIAEQNARRAEANAKKAEENAKIAESNTKESEKVSESIIQDLLNDKLINDTKNVSFSISGDEFIVNNKKMESKVHFKYTEKYKIKKGTTVSHIRNND